MIPGATGDAEGGMMQVLSRKALDLGYNVFISNPLAPVNSETRDDLEVINYSKNGAVKEAV